MGAAGFETAGLEAAAGLGATGLGAIAGFFGCCGLLSWSAMFNSPYLDAVYVGRIYRLIGSRPLT